MYFLGSRAWKSDIGVLAWSSEGSLPGHRLFVVSSHGVRREGALWGLFYEDTNSIHEGSSLLI